MAEGTGGNNGSYSPNATVVTTGGTGGIYQPKTLISAISQIQQFYVIESQGQKIPGEFLTLEDTIGFFKVGAGSGFNEGIFLFILFPIFKFYLLPFVLTSNDVFSLIVLGSIPYLPIIVNTLLCSYISRYYVGIITRKAINSLFIGRSILLMVKSLVIYTVYYFLFHLSTPERVWAVAQHFGKNSEIIFSNFITMMPHIMPTVTRCSIFILMSAILPYGTVYFLDMWRSFILRRNQSRISGTN